MRYLIRYTLHDAPPLYLPTKTSFMNPLGALQLSDNPSDVVHFNTRETARIWINLYIIQYIIQCIDNNFAILPELSDFDIVEVPQ